MAPKTYTRIALAERPKGEIDAKTFRKEVVPLDLKPQAKQVLVKTLYLSLDPTMRTWINDARGYMEPVKIGDVMRGGGLGVVVEAGPDSRFKPGDIVDGLLGYYICITILAVCMLSLLCDTGWTEYSVHDDKAVHKVEYVGLRQPSEINIEVYAVCLLALSS